MGVIDGTVAPPYRDGTTGIDGCKFFVYTELEISEDGDKWASGLMYVNYGSRCYPLTSKGLVNSGPFPSVEPSTKEAAQ
jgi:hypothetical protein